MSDVRVRFAPSPTGHLHIGSARTAIFNWLFARHHGGKFLLRIEDTDPERSKAEYTEAILEGLSWLGLDWDEEPLYQSSRLAEYRNYAQRLLEQGRAYYCSCTEEELDQMRKYQLANKLPVKYDGRCFGRKDHPPGRPRVIRFRSLQEGQTEVDDIIQGKVVFDNAELDDLIIIRKDGTPTYNFGCVVDDTHMRISHVIRGDDHLNNTPRQIQIYRALGLEPPKFAHHPLILAQDRSKLSKRHGATALIEYRQMGYLPEALFNFLVRIGWGHGDQEIFTKDEVIKYFDLKNLTRSAGIWNPEKLDWINGNYIRASSIHRLADLAIPFFQNKGYPAKNDDYLAALIRDYRERVNTIADFASSAGFYYVDQVEYDEKARSKFLTPDIAPMLEILIKKLEAIESFNKESLEMVFKEVMDEMGLKMKNVAQPVRVALTGGTASPGIFEVLQVLGSERVLNRLKRAVKVAKGKG
jgi:glutamyl-tRNA synthetase